MLTEVWLPECNAVAEAGDSVSSIDRSNIVGTAIAAGGGGGFLGCLLALEPKGCLGLASLGVEELSSSSTRGNAWSSLWDGLAGEKIKLGEAAPAEASRAEAVEELSAS